MPIGRCDFYHQWGHNDQTISLEMVREGYCSGVILSPRHLRRPATLEERWVPELLQQNTPFLIDPQCYDPEYDHGEYPLGLGSCLLDQQRRAAFVERALE